MMVVLPLLVLPFITMAFWALGGGKGTGNDADKNKVAGLNLQLPNANLKSDKNEDKLSFYMEADADSLKRAELLRSDPFYKDSLQTKVSLMEATPLPRASARPASARPSPPRNRTPRPARPPMHGSATRSTPSRCAATAALARGW